MLMVLELEKVLSQHTYYKLKILLCVKYIYYTYLIEDPGLSQCMGFSSVHSPHDCMADWSFDSPLLPSSRRYYFTFISSRQRSKFTKQFLLNTYCFHTIMVLDLGKLGIIYNSKTL